MTITLTSTTRIVDIEQNGATIQARVWEGETKSGITVFALITRVAARKGEDLSQFEQELEEQAAPTAAAGEVWPARVIL